MAQKVKLECKIKEVKQVPNSRVYLISVEYRQGKKSWHKGWRFTPEKPVSMEWLEREIAKLDPWPEQDLMQNVKDEAPHRTFNIEVDPTQKQEVTQAITGIDAVPDVQQQPIAVPPGTIIE